MTRADRTRRIRPHTLGLLTVALAAVIAIGLIAPAQSADKKKLPYRSPYDLAYSHCGKMLAVSDFTAGELVLLQAGSDKVMKRVKLKGMPTGLAWSDDCKFVFVAEECCGSVAQVEVAGGKVARRFKVGARPIGVALAAKRKLLFVTNSGTDDVSVVDLNTGKETKRIKVLREPVSVAVTPHESIAVVPNFLPDGPSSDPKASASVSLIDIEQMKTMHVRLPAGSTLVRSVAISPCGCWAYVVHTVGRFNIPTTQLERGWVNTNAMSIIKLRDRTVYATVLLDHPSQGSADPWGVLLSKDGKRMWVSLAGVHKVADIDLDGLHKLLKSDFSKHPKLAKPDPRNPGPQSIWLEIKKDPKNREQLVNELAALHAADLIENIRLPGKGPRGIDVSPDGKQLAVAMYYSGQIQHINVASRKPAKVVSLGPSRKPDAIRIGEINFHDGTLCFQHWLSCATCHPNARVDGLNWDLLNDGMGNPKNTKTMVLSAQTPPAMARGVRADMGVASLAGFRHILFRQPTDEEVKTVRAYLTALKPDKSPYLTADGKLTKAALRGKALFMSPKLECATCHPEGLFTDLKMYDVGTKHELDRAADFDTPTLIEAWRTGPYLHDGSAATLKDVVTKFNKHDKHGKTSHLNEQQINDLVAYLLSL